MINRRKNKNRYDPLSTTTPQREEEDVRSVIHVTTPTTTNKRNHTYKSSIIRRKILHGCQVAIGVWFLCSSAHHYYHYHYHDVPSDDSPTTATTTTATATFSSMGLEWDAYGMADSISRYMAEEDMFVSDRIHDFINAAQQIRDEFSHRYGGERTARSILQQATTTFDPTTTTTTRTEGGWKVPESIEVTAYRMVTARKEQRPFHMAFGGRYVYMG